MQGPTGWAAQHREFEYGLDKARARGASAHWVTRLATKVSGDIAKWSNQAAGEVTMPVGASVMACQDQDICFRVNATAGLSSFFLHLLQNKADWSNIPHADAHTHARTHACTHACASDIHKLLAGQEAISLGSPPVGVGCKQRFGPHQTTSVPAVHRECVALQVLAATVARQRQDVMCLRFQQCVQDWCYRLITKELLFD